MIKSKEVHGFTFYCKNRLNNETNKCETTVNLKKDVQQHVQPITAEKH